MTAETNKLSDIVIGYSAKAISSSFNIKRRRERKKKKEDKEEGGLTVGGGGLAESLSARGQSADVKDENELPSPAMMGPSATR